MFPLGRKILLFFFLLNIFFSIRQINPIDQVFAIVRDMVPSSGLKVVRYGEAKERCIAKGLKPDTFDDALERYEEMGLWHVNQQRTTITIV
jgi:DNA replication licensing factor MCM7